MAPFDKLSKYYENRKVRSIEEVTKLDIGKGERLAYKFNFASIKDLESVRDELRKDGAELREYDVPYYQRFCIDKGIRVGNWYYVYNEDGVIELKKDEVRQAPPQPRILAFDIECSKEELQFPDAEKDEIMMISYMVDGEGFLVTNRQWFSKDIESFEYSPLEFYCEFTVWNCANEYEMLVKWFDHVRTIKPHVMVTFNGDSFDWPFVARRAELNGLNLRDEIGYGRVNKIDETFSSHYAPHIDCFKWVERDSYLPTGSHGLKAVTRAKLQYDPLELDPEVICPMGVQDPQRLANYSVSDAYATYYLYIKYVHPFIFSLTTVLPVNSDDCLRKGTGTLCECLLMARAYECGIFFPNKSVKDENKTWRGHLLISETYVGGRVEALQSGIFRDDILTDFDVSPEQYQRIIDRVPDILSFIINTELRIKRDDVENYEEVQQQIVAGLEKIRDNPKFKATPVIIHLDVAAMYPNIILTNRLQPTAIVNESICAKCPMKTDKCQRRMEWQWRGEYFPATEAQANSVLRQLESEVSGGQPWFSLSVQEQAQRYKKRLGEFCKKVYQKQKETLSEPERRTSIICMKENSFYVDTVRSFRDRRYEFKNLLKVWNGKKAQARTPAEREEVKKMIVLYDSLQLAHKCLLNSFYGYVMRGGARWRSMEMAGVVTHTGATIIKQTRAIVEGLGKGLELDTDGIWSAFPPEFPMNFQFKLKNGQRRGFSFPCSMLNENVDHGFSNYQYHELNPETGEWTTRKENSIFFELDGPYHAMFLPAAKEEGKKLKKRYAVFNSGGHITELKGFEIKRRGEWKMIKMLQSDAFVSFMRGDTNEEVYRSVADVCKQYLMVLKTKGKSIEDDELLTLMSESSTMSKSLSEYGDRKSPAATTAKRLAELRGPAILEGKGLKCEYIISRLPTTASIAARAIPILIFQSKPEVILSCLRRWCGDASLVTTDFRDIIDWEYYTKRLHGTLQKILVIPAFLQGIVLKDFDVPPPDWLLKKQKEEQRMRGQTRLDFAVTHEKGMAIVQKKTVRDESELTDYQQILLKMKRKWRQARVEAIERPMATPVFKDWKVLEIRASSEPGVVTAFVQTGMKSVMKIDVDVPRVFYINSTEAAAKIFQENLKGRVEVTNKPRLPHSFPVDVVTRITLSESEFLKYKSVLTSSFSSTDVFGVYETNVTPMFRSLCAIGTSITKTRKNRVVLTDVKSPKKSFPLDVSNLNTIFIYSCMSKKRGLIAMVPILGEATSAEPQVFMFYNHQKDVTLNVPSMKNRQEAAIGRLPPDVRVVRMDKPKVHHLQNVREAAAALQTALAKFGRTESSFVLMNSHLRLDQFLQSLKVIALHQYPVVTINYLATDDVLDDTRHDKGWQTIAFENFTTRYIQAMAELKTTMECSDLLDTPIGNINGDICMKALDLQFARELKANNYIMWYSESSEPDVGGSYSNSLLSMPGNPFQPISTNRSGTYMSRCVEYHVSHLSTAAVIGCRALIDKNLPQETELTAKDFSTKPSIDAMPLTKRVFEILAKFIEKVVTKCNNERNILSSMIGHIGTWLSSSSSVFYDPAVHSVFRHFLAVIFDQLVKFFEGNDIPIVYADQSRLIVNLGVIDPQPVFQELDNTQLLRFVNLTLLNDFGRLVWIDEYNYQGIVSETEYVSQWNIENFLTPKYARALRDFFKELLLFDPENLMKMFESNAEILFQLANDSKYAPTVRENPLRSPKDITNSDFLLMMNTFFYAVESLTDKELAQKIQSVRSSALGILTIREFDPRTKFVNPSLSLVVPSVLCKHCLTVRDIDILRDDYILEGKWMCHSCDSPYNVTHFERWLFEEFSRRYKAYQTQDLRCERCQKVQARKVSTTCDDGGNFKNSTDRQELLEYMRTIWIAAKHHHFTALQEVLESYMQYS